MRTLKARTVATTVLRAYVAIVGLTVAAIFVTAFPSTASSQGFGNSKRTDQVTAVLVAPWIGCTGLYGAWQVLNDDWQAYGSTPLSIMNGGRLCGYHWNLSDLEASGADVVVLSSCALYRQLSAGQLQALQTYADEGHPIVASGILFAFRKHDDGGLAPILGLSLQQQWNTGNSQTPPAYNLKLDEPPSATLFRDVANPYIGSNQGPIEKPADRRWTANELAGAYYIGRTKGGHAALIFYQAPSYSAIYVTSMAEYMSSDDDLQFLYNALVYPNSGGLDAPGSGG